MRNLIEEVKSVPSERDGEWAKEMLVLHLSQIDRSYLEQRAAAEGVAAALQGMLESARK